MYKCKHETTKNEKITVRNRKALSRYKKGDLDMLQKRKEKRTMMQNQELNTLLWGEASLEKILEKADRIADQYHLSDESAAVLKELCTCRFQTRGGKDPENLPFYNLFLLSDDTEQAMDLVRDINRIIAEISGKYGETLDISKIHKEGAFDADPASVKYRSWKDSVEGCFRRMSPICVLAGEEPPVLDVDSPTGPERKKNMDDVKKYRLIWDTILELAQMNPQCTLLVVSTPYIYRRFLKHDTELVDCVCTHRIMVPEMTREELYQKALLSFCPFRWTEGFRNRLWEYICAEYPRTDLSRKQFLKSLKNSVMTKYYMISENNRLLDEWMLPTVEKRMLTPENVLQDLNGMVGLDTVKKEFNDMYISSMSGSEIGKHHHMLFLGNPGTAKTTVAKMTAEMFASMGILRRDKLVECKVSDFISEWKNATGKKTREKIKEAYGGVLFIDEAYALAVEPEENNDAKKTVVETLMTEMEENADKLIVIFAGYEKETLKMLDSNPGLRSRIRHTIHFPDYTVPELKQILMGFATKDGFIFNAEAEELLDPIISARKCEEHFGNGRDMRNLWEDIRKKRDKDLYNAGAYTVEDMDVPKIIVKKNLEDVMPKKVESGIDDMIGLKALKEKIADFTAYMMYMKLSGQKGIQPISHSRHMAFTGNPGTGKTTVAKRLAQEMYTKGTLLTNKCIVTSIADLVKDKEPSENIMKFIKKAEGGILFIDEAYSLAESDWGFRIIEILLVEMEKHKDDTIFVFAGYTEEMEKLFAANPGLESRIGYIFDFPDYSLDELYEIFVSKITEAGYQLCDGVETAVKEVTDYFMDIPHFGNGRFMENVIKEVLHKRARREYDEENYCRIEASDIPTVAEMQRTIMNGTLMNDPTKQKEERVRRTAIHELGHALVYLLTDPESVPESISIRGRSSSNGRVMLDKEALQTAIRTEQWCMDHIAILLAGRNAEKICLGEHSVGCSSDYEKACKMAKRMIKEYAMGQLGVTKKKDILREADARSCEMIEHHRAFIDSMTDRLLREKYITGEDLRTAFQKYLSECTISERTQTDYVE